MGTVLHTRAIPARGQRSERRTSADEDVRCSPWCSAPRVNETSRRKEILLLKRWAASQDEAAITTATGCSG